MLEGDQIFFWGVSCLVLGYLAGFVARGWMPEEKENRKTAPPRRPVYGAACGAASEEDQKQTKETKR